MSRLGVKRLIGYGLGLLGLLLLLCVGALSLMLYHPAAPGWLLEQVRERTDLNLDVAHYQGTLAGPLNLQGTRLQGDFGQLEIGRLDLDWRPAALWRWQLHIASLRISQVRLSLAASEPDTPDTAATSPGDIELPLGLRIDRLLVEDVLLEQPDQAPQRLDAFSLQAWSQADSLHLDQLSLAMPGLELQASGLLGLTAPWPAELELAWRLEHADWPAFQGQGDISGDLTGLQLQQTVNGPVSGDLQARLHELTREPSWQASLRLQPSELGGWLLDFPLRAGGELQGRGTLKRIGLEGRLDLASTEYGQGVLSLKADYADGIVRAEQLRLETPAGGRLDLVGDYRQDQATGRFDGQLNWQALQWPLQGENPQLSSRAGSLKLSGSPSDYGYELNAWLTAQGQPPLEIASSGRGDLQAIRLEHWLAKLDPGRLQGRGELTWRPALAWKLSIEGEEIDPSHWLDQLPGRLGLTGETQGKMTAEGLSADFRLERLEGRVRDYPVAAAGRGALQGGELDLQGLYLTSGSNRLDVDGTVGRELALDWRVEAPELPALWPGLEGSLSASGRLEGAPQTPRLQAAITAGKLAFATLQADSLKLDADLSLAGRQTVSLQLAAEGLQTPAGNWRDLDLDLSGSLPSHRLNLSLQGGKAPALTLGLAAGWRDEGLWQGQLDQLSLKPEGQAEWRLAGAAGFTLGAKQQGVQNLCLQAGQAKLCGEFDSASPDTWETKLNLQAFPLATLQAWLPEGWQVEGLAEGQADLAKGTDGQLLGDWRLDLSETTLALNLTAQAEPLRISRAELLGGIDPEGVRSRMEMALAELGELEGELNLPGYQPLDPASPSPSLQGGLRFSLKDLSRLSQLSPRLLDPRGDVAGDFTLAGTLAQPRLIGSAELRQGALDIPELGLELREIELSLTAPSLERLALQGGLRSGKGRLNLAGHLDLDAKAGFPAQLELSGREITVANLPEAEIHVTPALKLERNGKESHLKGQIEIPYARLRPRKLPKSAVKASSDLVLVGEDQMEQRSFDPRLSTNLQLVMGDRVSFDGFGLRGKLSGRLIVIDEPGRPVIGRGRIGISDGTYQAYGQDLSIERGYALFADSPVDNPGLDVRAVRELDQVTAGVQVGGTLKKPKIDLFSTPSMSEGDVLSYLLTGRPQGEGGGGGLGIAAAIRASGAGTVAEEIGRQFGLEELRFDAGSGLEEASVVAGTYLSPRLYIQYVNELASRETKVRLRYDINLRLQLEAETGKTQAGDLYYTFDR